ncbi:uncharacterized protein [Amphiura filiformis]|uniref:uncharacterized protein n=1 Tax=Amphiura filiformis TaxID=82378 RepID=UPI003B218970
MCLEHFVALKSGCMYSFLLFMVLIARCVRSELSLSSEQCSPLSINANLESDFELREQIHNLSERVENLQHVLFNGIQHYGPMALQQCDGAAYTGEIRIPICNIFNDLPESVRASCPETVCETGRMRQAVATNDDFPWERQTSTVCDEEATREWQPIPHHIPVLQTYHTMLVGNILQSANRLRHDALISSVNVMANTFHDVLCGMETTRDLLNHSPLADDSTYGGSSEIIYSGVSLDLQNIVIMQSMWETLEHIIQDLNCLQYWTPISGTVDKRSSNSNSFPVWLAQQRQARLRKKSWSNDNVISKLLKKLRN